MSITSTAGYTDWRVYNNLERVFFIFTVYVGDAFFAIAFGIIAQNVQLLPEKYYNLFKNMRKLNQILDKSYSVMMPKSL